MQAQHTPVHPDTGTQTEEWFIKSVKDSELSNSLKSYLTFLGEAKHIFVFDRF